MESSIAERKETRIDALHRRLAENSLGGHWQTRARKPQLVPHLWRWDIIRSCLMESGEVIRIGHIDEAAKRRTVNLVNPSLTDEKTTSRTIQMSVQLVKPGETAECHRHTAAALRFVVEGDGSGYTTVEGEQMLMEPGDLVLTPHWTWHDHYNGGNTPLVWLDVLDTQLTNYLDATVHENYPGDQSQRNQSNSSTQPITKPDGYCRQHLGVVRPRSPHRHARTEPYTYKWKDTLAVLESLAARGEKDPFDGILVDYTNPLTGGPTMPTINCTAQLLAPGETTRPHRHTSSSIYHVMQGEGLISVGATRMGDQELRWGEHDCFFIPSRHWHCFENTSRTTPAVLFAVSDRPVLEALGLYREEQLTEQ